MRSFVRSFVFACVALFASVSIAATEQDAVNFSTTMGNEVLALLNAGGTTQSKHAALEKKFTSLVDVEWIGKFVMGKHWRPLEATQQTKYMAEYRRFIIANYTSNFVDYTSGTTFKVLRAREEKPGKFYVSSEIVRPGKPSVIFDYRVRAEGESFVIYDIIVEGISLITAQRSEFDAVMSQKGFDFLLKQITDKANTAEQKVKLAKS